MTQRNFKKRENKWILYYFKELRIVLNRNVEVNRTDKNTRAESKWMSLDHESVINNQCQIRHHKEINNMIHPCTMNSKRKTFDDSTEINALQTVERETPRKTWGEGIKKLFTHKLGCESIPHSPYTLNLAPL